MGRVGSCFDNAASEAFFSTLEHEVLSRHRFATKAQARAVVTAWCHDFYNLRRRHSSAGLLPPVEYEKIAAIQPGPHRGSLHDSGGSPAIWIEIWPRRLRTDIINNNCSTTPL